MLNLLSFSRFQDVFKTVKALHYIGDQFSFGQIAHQLYFMKFFFIKSDAVNEPIKVRIIETKNIC